MRAVLVALLAGCLSPAPPGEDRQADRYRRPDLLIPALGLRPGDRVAEIGAGGGYLTLRLARAVSPGGRVLATDIDPAALAALRARARAAGLGHILAARHVRPDEPGLEGERFDLILLAQVDHLLPDRAGYLRALVPSLLPGGRIALCNAERHRPAAEEAAARAGLHVREVPVGLPAQVLLLLWPQDS